MITKTPKNIALRVGEIADAYALETLYNEMKDVFPDKNIYFSVHCNADTPRKMLEKYPLLEKGHIQPDYKLVKSKPDLVVMVGSDTTEDLSRYEKGPFRILVIDAPLLKAMKKFPVPGQLRKIKKEYGLENLQKPLAVMGWLPHGKDGEKAKKLITSLIPDVHFVVTPDRKGFPALKYMNLREEELASVTEVEGIGHLAKLSAIADVSFSGWNLAKRGDRLNNFYEQSSGGPFFLTPTANTKQYGYKELVKQGLVIPCVDIEDIINQSTAFLEQLKQTPELKNQHKKKWLAHRNKTRRKFLPEIFDRIEWLLQSRKKPQIFTYIHPESDWGGFNFNADPIDIFDDSYKHKLNKQLGREGKC